MPGFPVRSQLAAALAAAALGAASVASADITIQSKSHVDGVVSFANMNGTSTTSISGRKARIESDMQMENRMMRMLARGVGASAELIQLDADKVYELNVKKKEYTEESISVRRERMQQAMEQATKSQPPAGGVDESQCEWQEPKADVKKTGEKTTVAGFDAERVQINASQACKDPKSGSVCEFNLSLDQWVAPSFNGGDDARQFYSAYAQQMGLDSSTAAAGSERAEALFGKYKGMWAQVAAKMHDVKGYPVRSTFALAIGGPQCKSSSSSGSTEQSSGGSESSTPGGIAGRIAGSLFHKKSQDKEASAPQPTPGGLVPLITVNSELVSVSTAPVPAAMFEPPADFKKVLAK